MIVNNVPDCGQFQSRQLNLMQVQLEDSMSRYWLARPLMMELATLSCVGIVTRLSCVVFPNVSIIPIDASREESSII